MISVLAAPYAFPLGAHVHEGPYRGVVVAQPGPYSVRIRDPNGRLLTMSTTGLALDAETPADVKPVSAEPDLFSLI